MTTPVKDHLYLITAAADYLPAAVDEVRRAARGTRARYLSPLTDEVALIESEHNLGEMHAAIRRAAPIFVRHIVPAQRVIPLEGASGDVTRLADVTMSMPEIEALEPGDRISVQACVLTSPGEKRPYTPYAIADTLIPRVTEATGATIDVRNPELVISILVTPSEGYVGLSPVEFNRSDWAGGERRFRREKDQVSRSEFKLLEALEVFGVELPARGTALDLGAAPGGWARVLLSAGMRVVTVDPARLDPVVARHKMVRHIRGYAHDVIERESSAGTKYDVLVSDIKMDARDAARLIVQTAPLLALHSFAILTLKLPSPGAEGMDPLTVLETALAELRSRYRTVRARQLFHNRNEVTVYLEP